MRHIFWVVALFISAQASSQTLFTYGKDSVRVKDFLQAYNKNNTSARTAKAMQEYLDLYIASRLKIKEAQGMRYDTLPQMIADVDNLRKQILPMYEKDQETVNKLTEEAFMRSQKDIHLAHIFIGFANEGGIRDTIAARKKAMEAMQQLARNVSFSEVATKYSDDPSVKDNGGDLGYITVFTLPYQLENLAYKTPAGKTSLLYRSEAGYHIFKNLGERKALGKIKGAQILIAFPPETNEAQKRVAKKLADSLFLRISKGDDFGKLATKFSGDIISAAANGTIPDFGVGQYDAPFENAFFRLKDGAVSKPFLTQHGYHIVKRIKAEPVSATRTALVMQAMKEKTEQSDRINSSKYVLIKKVFQQAGYKKLPYKEADLWAYTDSLFNSKQPSMPIHLSGNTPIFTLGNDTTLAADWITFAQTARYKDDGSGFKPYPQVWDEFIDNSAMNYYTDNLENFSPEFKSQMAEFKEGNLFFEIMQRQIWGPAQTDTVALKLYYQKDKGRYLWTKSADAVIFYAGDINTAQQLAAQIRKAPATYKELVNAMADKVTADSGRFELKQIPSPTAITLIKGTITQPLLNKADNTASFAYILHEYNEPEERSFEEAKGLVINDYQAALEKRWLDDLKKKYPVIINQAQWAGLLRTASK